MEKIEIVPFNIVVEFKPNKNKKIEQDNIVKAFEKYIINSLPKNKVFETNDLPKKIEFHQIG